MRLKTIGLLLALAMMAVVAPACSDDGDGAETDDQSAPAASSLEIVGADYSFNGPASAEGGTVAVTFRNEGQEPHFMAFAQVADGKTFEDVQAALTAPPSDGGPSGPPPFVEQAGIPVIDPGVSSQATVTLPAGEYALFCALPAPDGVPHSVKGMIAKLTVTEGSDAPMPQADASVTGSDFAFDSTPQLSAGESKVNFRNEGKQLHEIALVKLADGKTIDDLAAWHAKPEGPPPAQNLGGVAVAPGAEGVAELSLEPGGTYALICAIPDVLGDFAAHVTKGMRSQPITV